MLLFTLLLYGGLSFILFVIAFFLYFAILTTHHKKHFKKQGVPFVPSKFSSFVALFREKMSLVDMDMDLYKEAVNTGQPLVGMSDATGPLYYITDVELMKHIYVKDFEFFMNRRAFATADADMLTKMLMSMEGDKWKAMRSKISPTFTTSKIKRVFDIFDSCSLRMCEYIKKYGATSGELDMTKIHAKFATDLIASCVFGVEGKCFERDPDSQSYFEQMGSAFQFKVNLSFFLKVILVSTLPNLARHLNIQVLAPGPQKYFTKIIKDVMKRRREKGEKQEDFLQLLMDTQEGLLKEEEGSKETLEVMAGSDSGEAHVFNSNTTKLNLDDDTIVANCEQFLLAGFDTTKSVLLYSTYALAVNQEVQERVFEEIQDVLKQNGGKLSYDAINKMTYLEAFLNENLRFYSANTRTERKCTKDYPVPGMKNCMIPKGSLVILPIYPLHHDERHYENVEKFDPERFLGDRKHERHPFSYSPFGHGPRNCIGMRFALFEIKAMIFRMVQHFKLQPCSRTDIPPKFSTSPNLSPKNGMWLKFTPRSSAN